MKRKALREALVLAPFLAAALQPPALAATYNPAPLYHIYERSEKAMRPGSTVHLFHSGTAVVAGIHPGDILTVYRVNSLCEVKAAGKVRVLSFVGDNYIRGEVIEGAVMQDDIARKGKVSCLVIAAGFCGQQ